MKRWIGRILAAVVALGILGGGLAWFLRSAEGQTGSFTSAPVSRGDLVITIDATGTLEPEEVVDVGAQVAGQILSFGNDADGKTVDYGSQVEVGTVLARIDEALFKADVDQAEAELRSAQAGVRLAEAKLLSLKSRVTQAGTEQRAAEAGVQRAAADLEQLKARLAQAKREWDRASKIGPSDAMSTEAYEGYQSAWEVATANIGVGEASVLQAKATLAGTQAALAMAQSSVSEGEASLAQAQASVTQAETRLWRAKRNLGYCTIASPVKGVIIDRRVNVGQTVVASLNAPSLFLIAKDLKRMQVWVAVNEADVARIHVGQPVSFTVDALPDRAFRGEVGKVRLNAAMTQNVVTYTVEIVTENADLKLLPYLTANARFEVRRRDNVLRVPGTALRWTPTVEQVAPAYRDRPLNTQAVTTETDGTHPTHPGVVYAIEGSYVRPIPVRTGISSGAFTEVEGEELKEGMELVTGVQATPSSGDTSNPFTPKLPPPPKGVGPPH